VCDYKIFQTKSFTDIPTLPFVTFLHHHPSTTPLPRSSTHYLPSSKHFHLLTPPLRFISPPPSIHEHCQSSRTKLAPHLTKSKLLQPKPQTERRFVPRGEGRGMWRTVATTSGPFSTGPRHPPCIREREFFIDNPLVRIHLVVDQVDQPYDMVV
jgi:hypothetical protein